MKSSVYNIFDDVNETEFPEFKKVDQQSKFYLNFSLLVFQRCSCVNLLCRLSGWSAFKNKMKLSLCLVVGTTKFIIW